MKLYHKSNIIIIGLLLAVFLFLGFSASATTNKSSYILSEPIFYTYGGYKYKRLEVRASGGFFQYYDAGRTENFDNAELQTLFAVEFPVNSYTYELSGVEDAGYPVLVLESGGFSVIDPPTANSRLEDMSGSIVNTFTNLAVKIFTDFWPFFLILSILTLLGGYVYSFFKKVINK